MWFVELTTACQADTANKVYFTDLRLDVAKQQNVITLRCRALECYSSPRMVVWSDHLGESQIEGNAPGHSQLINGYIGVTRYNSTC